jgi:hypothetical protein
MEIRFRSSIAGLSATVPPKPAADVRPDWLKGPRFHAGFDRATPIEQASREASTIRRCPGIMDAMRDGYVVPLWTDLHVKFDGMRGEVEMRCASPWAGVDRHPIEQFKSTPIETWASPYTCVFKLANPWRVYLPAGYSSRILDPVYHRNWVGFSVLPGVVDHDRFHTANIFLVWERYDAGELIIPLGTPLFQLIPFRRAQLGVSVSDSPDTIAERAEEDVRVSGWVGRYHRLFRGRRSRS